MGTADTKRLLMDPDLSTGEKVILNMPRMIFERKYANLVIYLCAACSGSRQNPSGKSRSDASPAPQSQNRRPRYRRTRPAEHQPTLSLFRKKLRCLSRKTKN